ncbi:MAG: Glu/Leu/Phe/Val dehydrogenase [Desulfovibrio sp.]|nr:Glu/Leu/Phe/Val dehydrogenase [Desulfovibrio sp.]
MSDKNSAYEIAMQSLAATARLMHLSDEITSYLQNYQCILVVQLPVRMDDGSLRFFTGYRVQHNSALGPVKGGIRLHKEETLDDVKALALWMSVKNSLSGIPAGGAKGGIAVDPDTISSVELERLCRAYIRAIYPVIGPKVDVPGPDVGVSQQVMAWFIDEYEILCRGREPVAFAGKPPLLGGSAGRDRATGRGLVYSAEKILSLKKESLKGQSVVIQGFGNLGSYAAQFFSQAGAIVTGISDVHGGVYNPDGLDVAAAFAHMAERGSVSEMSGADHVSNRELLELPCDLLVPCALQGQITGENASRIKARYIIEGANGPTTPEAEAQLHARDVCIVPDIVANAGGAVVAYFEMVQDLYRYFWEEDEVFSRLKLIMDKTAEKIFQTAMTHKFSMRQASWIEAINRIVEAMKLRGWVGNSDKHKIARQP